MKYNYGSKDLPPVPVIRLDFSELTSNKESDMLKKDLIHQLKSIGKKYNVTITYLDNVKAAISQLIMLLAGTISHENDLQLIIINI